MSHRDGCSRICGGILSRRGGFSLTETLFCVMILAISSSTLISAISVAARQFEVRTRESEQVFLCDTLTQAVQDQLTYVNEVELDLAVEDEGTGNLVWFKSGAISSLQQRECRFAAVLHTYAPDGENHYEESAAGWGEAAIQYDGGYYQLTDHKNYAVKRGNGGKELEARVEVTAVGYGTEDYFDVTISVRPQSEDTAPVINHFSVSPVNPKVLRNALG